jgi:hypothetical protein
MRKLAEENRTGTKQPRRRGGEKNNNVWKVVNKRCIDNERQKMEANMREKRSLALYNELKSSWEREKYIDICTFECSKVYRYFSLRM